MRFDYILMTINIWQPIEDIQLMLSLLSSSVLQNTFAMVLSGGKDKQTEYEGHVIDRISAMLIETPKTIDATKIYDAVDIAEMRLQALSVLEELADSRHGGEVLAVNTFAIGRLVRTMNDELNALYDYKYGHEYRYVSIPRKCSTVDCPQANLFMTELNLSTMPLAFSII